MGGAEAGEPGLLLAAAPVARGGHEAGAPGGMEGPGRAALAGLGQPFLGVLADRLQQPVRGGAVEAGLGDDHRLVDQAAERGERIVVGRQVAPHGERRREVQAAPEHRQPAEHPTLVRAPGGRGSSRSRRASSGGAPGSPHRVGRAGPCGLQPLHDVGQRQAPQAGRRQLDRQRQAVEAGGTVPLRWRGRARTARSRAEPRARGQPGAGSNPRPGSRRSWPSGTEGRGPRRPR